MNHYSLRFESAKDNFKRTGDAVEYKNELDKLYVDLIKAIKRHINAYEDCEQLESLLDEVDILLNKKELVA